MKNYELPANEIAKASPIQELFDLANEFDDGEPGESDVFPATWAISEALIKSYFLYKGVELATVKMLDSEGNGHESDFPYFQKIIDGAWGDSGLDDPHKHLGEDHYFEYGWSYNYTHIYELTINNKPALLFDIADGTSSSNFSMLQLVFAS